MATLNRIRNVFLNSFICTNPSNKHRYTNRFYRLTKRLLSISSTNPLLSSNSQSTVDKLTNISLTQSVPWLPTPQYAIPSTDLHDTKVTKLDNGLQVATQAKFGMFCTVGVLIDSGSRYEVNHKSGISHFLEKLAFSSTSKFPNKDAILQTLENHGGICDCQGSRDTLIYAVSASVDGLPDIIELLSEVTLKPNISSDESFFHMNVGRTFSQMSHNHAAPSRAQSLPQAKLPTSHLIDYARQAIEFELESINMRPDPEPLLVEIIHSAAYENNTLGLPKMCPVDNVSQIDRGSILNYLNQYHTPDRMVLAGVGVDHEELVALARKHFTVETTWINDPVVNTCPKTRDVSVAQYTGGSREVSKDLSNVSLGPTPMPELAHFVVALESCSHKHEDFVATCVLNMLMGGGGSFSAGGPGKGMYTRLYLNVLNKHHWIHNATAFNHAYNDSGLFCIHASAHPSSLKELTDVILRELVNTQNEISSEELNRAKTQLQSMLLMNLEARPVVFEDVGRQVLANGKRMPSEYYCDLIQKITEMDVQRVARRMLTSRPSIAALGNLNELPKYDDIRNVINNHIGNSSKRFSLFRTS